MAIIRFSLTPRTRTAASHSATQTVQYLVREGQYAPSTEADVDYLTRQTEATQTRDDLRHVEVGNVPAWANGDAAVFFQTAFVEERVNGRYATALQIALPRELTHDQQLALARDFVQAHLHDKPYLWVKHEPLARDGQLQPHIHLLFSERTVDGIARGPEQFFRRYNREHPDRGGAEKDRFWSERRAPGRLRESWATLANYHLEMAGVEARIDPRRLREQGIDRTPGGKWHRSPQVRDVETEHAVAATRWQVQKQALGTPDVHTVSREEIIQKVRERAREGTPGQARPRPSLEHLRDHVQTLQTTTQQLETHAARLHAEVLIATHRERTGQQPSGREVLRTQALLAQGTALGLGGLDDTTPVGQGVRVRLDQGREKGPGYGY